MNCKEIEGYSIEYLDGKLAGEKLQAVELHLGGCAACSERLGGFSDVSGLLDSWPSIEPSPSFNARLAQRLASAEANPMRWWERLLASLSWLPIGKPAFAGALLGMILFGVVLARYYPGSTHTAAPVSVSNSMVASTFADSNDELVPVLENLDLLSNFDVLQDLKTTNR
jgi:anti-sigma factor RsiW